MEQNVHNQTRIIESLNKVCHICFEAERRLISSMECVFSHRRPTDMLLELCPCIKVYDKDQLPMLICDGCTYSLNLAYEFKLKCEAACVKLKEAVVTKNEVNKDCYYIDNAHAIPNSEEVKVDEIYAAMNEIFGSENHTANHSALAIMDSHNIIEGSTLIDSRTDCDVENIGEFPKTKLEPTKKEVLDQLLVNHKIRLKEENSKVKIFKQKRKSKKDKIKSLSVPEQCNECGKIFKYSGYLEAHSRTHSGLKPFECKYCEKKFAQSGNLALHIKTHTKEKNFQCEICSKLFTTSSNLSAHQKIHSDVRDHPCHLCTRSFKSSSELASHSGVHTGIKNYKCKTCNKAFYKVSYLNAHIKTVHFKQKKYKCNQCDKEFSNSSNLNCHYRIHTGEKPYSCKYCAAKFNQSSALLRHSTKKHPNDDRSLEKIDNDISSQVSVPSTTLTLYDVIPSAETSTANLGNITTLNIQSTDNYSNMMEYTKMITPHVDKTHLSYTNNELEVNPCIDFSKNSMDTYVFNT